MSMEDEDFDEENCFTWVNFKFKTIRIVDNVFTSHVNKLKVEVSMNEDASELDIKTVLDKVHFWFDNIVSNGIIFERENEFALALMFTPEGISRTENIAIVTPDIPSDDNLIRIFHSKLNAFGGEHVLFGMMEMQSDTLEQLTVTYTGYGEFELPPMDEWVGTRAYYDRPWWGRDDGATLDVIPSEDADLSKPPNIGVDMSFIEKRYKKTEETAAIIVRPQFKPEVISGGKDDNDSTKD